MADIVVVAHSTVPVKYRRLLVLMRTRTYHTVTAVMKIKHKNITTSIYIESYEMDSCPRFFSRQAVVEIM